MNAHTALFILADKLSDVINPIFIALILQEPLLPAYAASNAFKRSASLRTFHFYLRAWVAVGLALTLAELGKKFQVWPGHSNFPSGHTTFAAASATCVILHRGVRWGWFVIPLALLMALSLVYGHWHTAMEVLAALVLGPTVAYLIWRLTSYHRS